FSRVAGCERILDCALTLCSVCACSPLEGSLMYRFSQDSTLLASLEVCRPAHLVESLPGFQAQVRKCNQCTRLQRCVPSAHPPGCRRSSRFAPELRQRPSSAPAGPRGQASWSRNYCHHRCAESTGPV